MPIPQSSGADSSAQQHIYDVFLSHQSGDKPQVEALAARLEDDEGVKPFLDKWHLIPGEPWQEALEEALNRSRTCAVFLGPGGLGPWENEEMRAALDERVRNKSFRVIPVLLPGAEPKDEKTLPRFLSRLTWVDFRRGLEDPETFRRLVAGIRGLPPGRQSAFTQQEDLRVFNEAQTKPARVGEAKHPRYRHTPKIVVFLSAGGTCRDPMAKAITTKLLEQVKPRPRIEIHAAGLGPSTAEEASYAARYVIREMYGEDLLKDHRPTLLTPALVARADLILAMDRSLLLTPGKNLPMNKAYVLKEFFGLQGDVADPWPDGKDPVTLQRYRACAEELKALLTKHIDRIVNVL
jgi:protein-tyrosine-phosphatase